MMDFQTECAQFYDAEKLYMAKRYKDSGEMYQSLINAEEKQIRALALMRLGEIANSNAKPMEARTLLLKAFREYPALASCITPKDHPSHEYLFPGILQEVEVKFCPLCGKAGKAYWSYCMVDYIDFDRRFNPVRTWMHCSTCHHLYASTYAAQPYMGHDNAHSKAIAGVVPALFTIYSTLLNALKPLAAGNSLLEVGIGNGELIAVAHEMMFDAVGIDISPDNVEHAKEVFHVNAECADFMQYQTDKQFDIICMGDVLEHLANPREAVKKAFGLLAPQGILWISTPNFEGAYSLYAGHHDPMKRVCDHLNYFSGQSIRTFLEQEGFGIRHYQISNHFNGSMEITAIKKQ